MGYKDLKRLENKTEEQKQFIETAEYHTQLISNDCEMNQICRHIENIDFEVKRKICSNELFDFTALMDNTQLFSNVICEQINREMINVISSKRDLSVRQNVQKSTVGNENNDIFFEERNGLKLRSNVLLDELLSKYTNNLSELTNYLIVIFYEQHKTWSKSMLWELVGEQIFKNCLQSCNKQIKVPVRQKDGEIRFWNDTFTVVQMDMNEEDQNDKDI